MDEQRRWVVVATKTVAWEVEADSAEDALAIAYEVMMPEEYPGEDPDDYQFTIHEMAGRVVYPHQEKPAFLQEFDDQTAELWQLREALDRLGDLSELPKTPAVAELLDEISQFLTRHRSTEE